METRVLFRSAPNAYAAFPPSQWCYTQNLIEIGQLALAIFLFEIVMWTDDGRTTDLVYYKLTLWAFGSGALKLNLIWGQDLIWKSGCHVSVFFPYDIGIN